jgi:hypothetical protein
MPDPSFQVSEYSAEEIEQASRVAKRLLGPPPPGPAGTYVHVRALENLNVGDLVVIDSSGNAARWKLPDNPNLSGMAINSLGQGCYGWILKS